MDATTIDLDEAFHPCPKSAQVSRFDRGDLLGDRLFEPPHAYRGANLCGDTIGVWKILLAPSEGGVLALCARVG